LTETDLDQRRGSMLVRHGQNDRRREVGMDAWGWSAYSDALVMPTPPSLPCLSCVSLVPLSA
jgi:hypothetical protein